VWWAQSAAASTDGMYFKVMLLCLYALYMSLCCTFFPLPTSWIVMLLAANSVELIGPPVTRMMVVAGVGALATGIANLNEYHIFTFLLRYGRVARVRDTKLYRWAAKWFAVSPFSVIVLFSFIPIPIDVVRLLAITCRYSRSRFFAGYFLGRFVRYALWAATVIWFDLALWHIILIQAVISGAVVAKILVSAYQRRKSSEGSRIAAEAAA
jgi:membrane protein YqaA with SNARE-associated domain